LMYQISHISRERGSLRRDDQVDALAGAIMCLQGFLFRSAEESEEDYEEAKFRAIYDEIAKKCGWTQKKTSRRFISFRR
jgi:hypothetical protein